MKTFLASMLMSDLLKGSEKLEHMSASWWLTYLGFKCPGQIKGQIRIFKDDKVKEENFGRSKLWGGYLSLSQPEVLKLTESFYSLFLVITLCFPVLTEPHAWDFQGQWTSLSCDALYSMNTIHILTYDVALELIYYLALSWIYLATTYTKTSLPSPPIFISAKYIRHYSGVHFPSLDFTQTQS